MTRDRPCHGNMSPASSGQPRPALAYALWLDSLTRAGWDAGPAAERAPVADALGRVSAAPIVARWPSPRSDCSAMDGIAVSAAGLAAAATARCPDRRPGGSAVRLAAGTFEWIDTGDPMPAGADTVVMREWLLPQEDGSVDHRPRGSATSPRRCARAGKNVRRAGEDFAAGEVLVPAGRRLRPGDLAAAAAAGHASVPCAAAGGRDHPDRGRDPAARIGRAAGRDPRHQLAHARRAVPPARRGAGGERRATGRPGRAGGGDPPGALGADLVLVIAGSSRGRDDHAAAVLAQVGGVAVTGVAVRPGHPALLGHAKRPGHAARAAAGRAGIAPVIGLPGYPLATAVIFELFAAPLLAALEGVRQPARPALLATLDRDWSSPPGIEDWVLVTLAPAAGLARRPPRPAARRHAGQARGRIDQPARPRRRLVADPGRSDRLRRRHAHRGAPHPRRRMLSAHSPPVAAAPSASASCCYLQHGRHDRIIVRQTCRKTYGNVAQ